ncbi:MAG TPA: VOC family protein, partial [Acidimicrobiia bacterium]|nr:VOC family protein [Acidimicrobiia bacterium]
MSFDRLSPVFPVRDIDLAVEHYGKLGFAVRRYEGPYPYAFAERDGIELHLAQVDDLEPRR